MTPSQPPEISSFQTNRRQWSNAKSLSVIALLGSSLTLITDGLAHRIPPLPWFAPLLATISGAVFLHLHLTRLMRIEITPDRLRIYFPLRFIYLDRAKVKGVDSPLPTPRSSTPPITMTDDQGRKFKLDPTQFADPDTFRTAILEWSRPVIARQAQGPPSPIWIRFNAWPPVIKILAAAAALGIMSIKADAGAIFVLLTLFAFVSGTALHDIAKQFRRITFDQYGIFVTSMGRSVSLDFEDVIEIKITSDEGIERLEIFAKENQGFVLTSAQPGYLHVRNFLLTNCVTAAITGDTNPDNLPLAPSTSKPSTTNSNNTEEQVRLTLGDQP